MVISWLYNGYTVAIYWRYNGHQMAVKWTCHRKCDPALSPWCANARTVRINPPFAVETAQKPHLASMAQARRLTRSYFRSGYIVFQHVSAAITAVCSQMCSWLGGTKTQKAKNIPDTAEIFTQDIEWRAMNIETCSEACWCHRTHWKVAPKNQSWQSSCLKSPQFYQQVLTVDVCSIYINNMYI